MPRMDEYLRLLADDTRLRILHLLAVEPLTVGELQDILDLGQSSVSAHLARLRAAGLLLVQREANSHRYRFRDDLADGLRAAWTAVAGLTMEEPAMVADRCRREELRLRQGSTWIERVAGSLHREYAPGRTWEALGHGLLHFADLGRCLDVGAGDGAMVELLAPLCRRLVCIDPSPAMIEAGRRRIAGLGLDGVEYLQAGGEHLPLAEASQDSVLFLQSLQYIADPAAALAEACRVLVPGGRLLIVTLNHHRFVEAQAYGHLHDGFKAAELEHLLADLADLHSYCLPAENRAPQFQALVVTGRRRPGERPRPPGPQH